MKRPVVLAALFAAIGINGLAPMANGQEIDEARARAAAVAMTALVDVQDWEGVRRHFAREVKVDYTSLFPGIAETMTREQLIERWKGLVPGFDATRHVLTDVEVEVDGNSGTGSARVIGAHFLDGRGWTVAGRYRYVFQRIQGSWRISALTFQQAGRTDTVLVLTSEKELRRGYRRRGSVRRPQPRLIEDLGSDGHRLFPIVLS